MTLTSADTVDDRIFPQLLDRRRGQNRRTHTPPESSDHRHAVVAIDPEPVLWPRTRRTQRRR
jgi:hypothetical protein